MHPRDVFQHQAAPGWVRALNQLGTGALRLGLPLVRVDEDALRTEAMRRTGLSDWGEGFAQASFERFTADVRGSDLTFLGRHTARAAILQALSGWLRLVDARKRHPELLMVPVQRPVIIAAMPRTGTTFLHHLLARHPDAMYLPAWLAMQPLPAPDADQWATGGSPDVRRRANTTARAINTVIPALKVIHPFETDLPVECSALTVSTFASNQLLGWPLDGFIEWLLEQDTTASYQVYREHLQLLQAGLPGDHWVLKSPGHFAYVGRLGAAVPEATIVQIHRDPARVFPSLFSMMAAHHTPMASRLDYVRMTELIVEWFGRAADRQAEERAKAGEHRIIDVAYLELRRDPMGVARRVCEAAGVRWDAQVVGVLEGWMAERAAEERGPRHAYPLDLYGHTPASLRARFRGYIEAFDIALED